MKNDTITSSALLPSLPPSLPGSLVGTSSQVVRVFFLDGSYKSVCFDKR